MTFQSAVIPESVRAAWAEVAKFFLPLTDTVRPNDILIHSSSPVLEHLATVGAWLSGGAPAPEPDLDQDRIAPVRASVPVVYAWTTGDALGDESWVAVCEDGELMASHISSSREFGQRDVHTSFGRVADRYRSKFGGLGNEFYVFVVVPEGKRPPREVMAANAEWAARVEAAVEPRFDAPS